MKNKDEIKKRLEYLRAELRAQKISYSEIAELQSLTPYIESEDIELLEAAGVPEGSPRTLITNDWMKSVYLILRKKADATGERLSRKAIKERFETYLENDFGARMSDRVINAAFEQFKIINCI